jgi:LmbE family N-acetylglucosaminyl deacetylase
MMRLLGLKPGGQLRVLCLGAHADDIEIGCGGTLLELIAAGAELDVDWCVLSAPGERASEARRSAEAFLSGARRVNVDIRAFRDGYFPYEGSSIKDWFESLKERLAPDVIFTHATSDLHQDHRETAQLTWNTFRDDLILEYEIPKWDGDLGAPNTFVPISEACLARKIALLETHYGSQRDKAWFDADTFRGLARLRGVECHSPTRFAEAFYARKITLALTNPTAYRM